MFCPRSRGCSEDSAMSEQRSPPRPDLLTDGEREMLNSRAPHPRDYAESRSHGLVLAGVASRADIHRRIASGEIVRVGFAWDEAIGQAVVHGILAT